MLLLRNLQQWIMFLQFLTAPVTKNGLISLTGFSNTCIAQVNPQRHPKVSNSN